MRRLLLALALACPLSPAGAWHRPASAMPIQKKPKSAAEKARLSRIAGEPGSGVPLDKQIKATDRARLETPLPLRPKDENEDKAVSDMEELSARYRAAHEAASHTLRELIKVESVKGRAELEKHYERYIRTHQGQARKMRAHAIKRYEDFLKIHADDATWTPEIMYRLAELHFEASNERLARQEEAWQKELEAYTAELEKNPKSLKEPPPSPLPDYLPSIALYRDLVERFPRFHIGDGALYMMGTLLYEMGELDQSRQAYLALACTNKFAVPAADGTNLVKDFEKGVYESCEPWKKDSPYAPESWLRVGEVHYDFDEFEPALEAYAQAAKDPSGDLYDEALIRMAWALYLMREFPAAAKKFDEFIRYADANKGKGESGAIALRDEAVKYLAKTYVEEDWDNDGVRDRMTGIQRLDRDYRDRGDERHVPEVYAALGDLLAYETEYKNAIAIWENTLARWPLAAAAPAIQARVLDAYERLQDKKGAVKARDALATNYLRGTRWFYANEADPDAIEAALKLAENALVATAVDHHLRAQELRAAGKAEEAKGEYKIAARAYEAYLERFPDTESSYEYRFNFADALYYSDQFVEASLQFAEVRDSNIDNRLQEDAADGAVLSLEAYIEAEATAGRIVKPEMPKEGMPGPFNKPKEIPKAMLALQEAYDRFVQVLPDGKSAGTMMYLAGEISHRYLHFKDAQKRFERVIDEHCEENVAINAGSAILDERVVLEDLKGAREWSEKLAEKGCGEGEQKEQFAGQLKALGNAVRFKEATILFDAGEFEAAADRYVALVDQAPADPNADRALNNAAVSYENIGRFSSASQTYKRIYTNYPDSDFADDALLRSGFNHSRFFEYEEAVASYLILAENERYKASEHRETALKNTAQLLESLQEYKRSAEMYKRYAEKSEDKDAAAEARFNAARVLGSTNDHKATIAAYQSFLNAHASDGKQAERSVEAQLRIGQAYASLGNEAKATEYYRATVSAFESRGLKPASEAAAYPSEAQFLLASKSLERVMATKLKSTKKAQLERESKQLLDAVVAATKEFNKVLDYKVVEWALAATYSKGRALEQAGINIKGAPVPKVLKQHSEAWFAYKDVVDQYAAQFEALALSEYESTLKLAKHYAVENEWTQAARERLNIYKPDEYPLMRPPALDLQVESLR